MQKKHSSDSNLPDIEIVDLEEEAQDGTSPSQNMDDTYEAEDLSGNADCEDPAPRRGIRRFLNLHVALIAVFLFVTAFIFFRLKDWGEFVDLDEIFQDGEGTYEDTLDELVPLLDADSKPVLPGKLDNIVMFGNNPLADDRDSDDNLANMIARRSGATVYNCSIANSYLSCRADHYDKKYAPMDGFSFYWLACLATGIDMTVHFNDARWALELIDQYPAEADQVLETFTALDFNTVDAIVIMYDATDYYMGQGMYNDGNRTDVTTFCGALEAGIEVLQAAYPHIRIIVMSPTYAYAVDKEGNYISSDQYTYGGQDVLSTYVIKQYSSSVYRNVSFIDNLYGTITEDNAKQYLTDNIHLNVEGRKLVAERCEYFLNYYVKGYGETE